MTKSNRTLLVVGGAAVAIGVVAWWWQRKKNAVTVGSKSQLNSSSTQTVATTGAVQVTTSPTATPASGPQFTIPAPPSLNVRTPQRFYM